MESYINWEDNRKKILSDPFNLYFEYYPHLKMEDVPFIRALYLIRAEGIVESTTDPFIAYVIAKDFPMLAEKSMNTIELLGSSEYAYILAKENDKFIERAKKIIETNGDEYYAKLMVKDGLCSKKWFRKHFESEKLLTTKIKNIINIFKKNKRNKNS